MQEYVEVVDPYDTLTPAEQRTFDAAFERRGTEFILRHGVSRRAVARGAVVVEKYRWLTRLPFPAPPQPADWHVWQARQAGRSYDALAADDGALST